jgi:aminopeptidase N
LAGRDPDEAPSTVYEKGALFLRRLEEIVGRERFDAFLRTYFDRFAFEPMTTEKFIAYLKQELPQAATEANLEQWIYGPGLPANAPLPKSGAFAAVLSQARAFGAGADISTVRLEGRSSHELVHFIRSLPEVTPEQMAQLDAKYRFSESGNAEVLAAWLEKSIDARYKAAYPALERLLTSMGRRKFLRPLYTKLMEHPDDVDFAKRVYAKARPTYHPVSQGTIDTIVK